MRLHCHMKVLPSELTNPSDESCTFLRMKHSSLHLCISYGFYQLMYLRLTAFTKTLLAMLVMQGDLPPPPLCILDFDVV